MDIKNSENMPSYFILATRRYEVWRHVFGMFDVHRRRQVRFLAEKLHYRLPLVVQNETATKNKSKRWTSPSEWSARIRLKRKFNNLLLNTVLTRNKCNLWKLDLRGPMYVTFCDIQTVFHMLQGSTKKINAPVVPVATTRVVWHVSIRYLLGCAPAT